MSQVVALATLCFCITHILSDNETEMNWNFTDWEDWNSTDDSLDWEDWNSTDDSPDTTTDWEDWYSTDDSPDYNIKTYTIGCDDTVSGWLSGDKMVYLNFTNDEQQNVVFTNCHSDHDTKMRLYTVSGADITQQSMNGCGGDDCHFHDNYCDDGLRETLAMEDLAAGQYYVELQWYGSNWGTFVVESHCNSNWNTDYSESNDTDDWDGGWSSTDNWDGGWSSTDDWDGDHDVNGDDDLNDETTTTDIVVEETDTDVHTTELNVDGAGVLSVALALFVSVAAAFM